MAETTGTDTPPPGWYPDPVDRTQQRYWDGSSWTRHTGHETVPVSVAPREPRTSGGPVSTWHRASFVVTYLLGGLLLGPVAMRYAGRARGAYEAGDRDAARSYAARARGWTIAAAIVGLGTIATLVWWLSVEGAIDLSVIGL